jgi:hypothetical protein
LGFFIFQVRPKSKATSRMAACTLRRSLSFCTKPLPCELSGPMGMCATSTYLHGRVMVGASGEGVECGSELNVQQQHPVANCSYKVKGGQISA